MADITCKRAWKVGSLVIPLCTPSQAIFRSILVSEIPEGSWNGQSCDVDFVLRGQFKRLIYAHFHPAQKHPHAQQLYNCQRKNRGGTQKSTSRISSIYINALLPFDHSLLLSWSKLEIYASEFRNLKRPVFYLFSKYTRIFLVVHYVYISFVMSWLARSKVIFSSSS